MFRGLSFFRLRLSVTEKVVDVGESAEVDEIESALREDVVAMEVARESQAVEMHAQMEMVRREAKAEARLEWEGELEERVLEERSMVTRAVRGVWTGALEVLCCG